MDERDEDRSPGSRADHVTYYRSLSRVIAGIEAERDSESDPAILAHLEGRIEAVRRDQARIRGMFPGVAWDDGQA